MSDTIARYALWILLCIPLFVLGFVLFGNLLSDVLAMNREKQKKIAAAKERAQKRQEFEEEYRRRHGGGASFN